MVSRAEIAERLGVSASTVGRWKRTGVPASRLSQVLALPARQAAEVLGVTTSTVYRRRKVGVKAPVQTPKKFVRFVSEHGTAQTAKMLGLSSSTIRRWQKTGISRGGLDKFREWERSQVSESVLRSEAESRLLNLIEVGSEADSKIAKEILAINAKQKKTKEDFRRRAALRKRLSIPDIKTASKPRSGPLTDGWAYSKKWMRMVSNQSDIKKILEWFGTHAKRHPFWQGLLDIIQVDWSGEGEKAPFGYKRGIVQFERTERTFFVNAKLATPRSSSLKAVIASLEQQLTEAIQDFVVFLVGGTLFNYRLRKKKWKKTKAQKPQKKQKTRKTRTRKTP